MSTDRSIDDVRRPPIDDAGMGSNLNLCLVSMIDRVDLECHLNHVRLVLQPVLVLLHVHFDLDCLDFLLGLVILSILVRRSILSILVHRDRQQFLTVLEHLVHLVYLVGRHRLLLPVLEHLLHRVDLMILGLLDFLHFRHFQVVLVRLVDQVVRSGIHGIGLGDCS